MQTGERQLDAEADQQLSITSPAAGVECRTLKDTIPLCCAASMTIATNNSISPAIVQIR
jgi:hypothetical protein